MGTSTRGSEDPKLSELMAETRACVLRKAGLFGAYQQADSPEGVAAWRRAGTGRGTYLYGPPGTGKTWAAACAVRAAVLRGRPARLVAASRLLDEIREGYDGGDRDAASRAASTWLLALDDLGAERETEWAVERLTRLVDDRTAAGLPTIVTSNYRLGQLRDRIGGVDGARIASRLGGACELVEMAGQDRRLA